MIIEKINPAKLILQVVAQNLDGTPKISLTSASVRVYSVNEDGTENELLTSTSLSHTVGSNIYRHVWLDPVIDEGYYIAEYTLIDLEGVITICPEDIVITRQVPTVTEIDNQLTQTHGDGSWRKGGSTGGGTPHILPG